jgi:hypothetical protein
MSKILPSCLQDRSWTQQEQSSTSGLVRSTFSSELKRYAATSILILILSSLRRTRRGFAYRDYNASWTQSWRMSRTLKKRLRRSPLSFYQPSVLNMLLQKGLHRRNKFGGRKIKVHLRNTIHYPRHQLINQWLLHLHHGSKYSKLLPRGNSVFILIFCIFRLAFSLPT